MTARDMVFKLWHTVAYLASLFSKFAHYVLVLVFQACEEHSLVMGDTGNIILSFSGLTSQEGLILRDA